GSGIFDYAHDRAEVVVRGSRDAMHRGLSPDVVEGRFIGSTSYLGFTLGGKKRWLKESGSVPSGTERFIPGPGGPSPGSVLNLLFKSSKEVEVLGKDEIRGVSAKHYR